MRYVDVTNNKIFAKTQDYALFKEITDKLIHNVMFIIVKSVYFKYRYVPEDREKIDDIDFYDRIKNMVDVKFLESDSKDTLSSKLYKFDGNSSIMDFLVPTTKYGDWHKKFTKSTKKMVQQYALFLDQVVQPLFKKLDTKDTLAAQRKKDFLLHRVRIKALIALFDKDCMYGPTFAPFKKKSTVEFFDGFVMEGKTERLESLKKEKGNVAVEEFSTWWRQKLTFANNEQHCLLDLPEFIMVPSLMEFLLAMGSFYKTEDSKHYIDRSLFSGSIFNGTILLAAFQFLFLHIYDIDKSASIRLFKKDYASLSFPLFPDRKFEEDLYRDNASLVLHSKHFYSRLGKLFQLLSNITAADEPYDKIDNDNLFNGLDTERLICF